MVKNLSSTDCTQILLSLCGLPSYATRPARLFSLILGKATGLLLLVLLGGAGLRGCSGGGGDGGREAVGFGPRGRRLLRRRQGLDGLLHGLAPTLELLLKLKHTPQKLTKGSPPAEGQCAFRPLKTVGSSY